LGRHSQPRARPIGGPPRYPPRLWHEARQTALFTEGIPDSSRPSGPKQRHTARRTSGPRGGHACPPACRRLAGPLSRARAAWLSVPRISSMWCSRNRSCYTAGGSGSPLSCGHTLLTWSEPKPATGWMPGSRPSEDWIGFSQTRQTRGEHRAAARSQHPPKVFVSRSLLALTTIARCVIVTARRVRLRGVHVRAEGATQRADSCVADARALILWERGN
jgi:hypothetical protein